MGRPTCIGDAGLPERSEHLKLLGEILTEAVSNGCGPDRAAGGRGLTLLGGGGSNPEIAAALYVSETTVKTHVQRILAKLGIRDRIQAVIFAYEAGVIRIGSHDW